MNKSESEAKGVSLLLPWYVNGTLSAGERAEVEQHLDGCRECSEAVAELQRIGTAVEKGEPTPLVPEPPLAEFLDQAFAEKKPAPDVRRMPWWSIAASVLAVIAGSYWMIGSLPDANVFRTVTDPSGSAEIAYVFDIDTAAIADESVRTAVAEAFAGGDVVRSGDGLRLTISMPSATMKELDEFANVLRQIEGVQQVEIVGVQLPLE